MRASSHHPMRAGPLDFSRSARQPSRKGLMGYVSCNEAQETYALAASAAQVSRRGLIQRDAVSRVGSPRVRTSPVYLTYKLSNDRALHDPPEPSPTLPCSALIPSSTTSPYEPASSPCPSSLSTSSRSTPTRPTCGSSSTVKVCTRRRPITTRLFC